MDSKKIVRSLLKSRIVSLAKPFKRFLPSRLKNWAKVHRVNELVSVEDLKPQYQKACQYLIDTQGKESIGDYLEFGVSHGTSISCMHKVFTEFNLNKVRLFGFDSFEGMPKISNSEDGGQWYPGQFRSELEETTYFLTKKGIDWKRTFLIKGWFSDTLTDDFKKKHNITKASIIMIDCDIYSSSKEALNFCLPMIRDKSILVFDDWNSGDLAEKNMGEKRAFDEFMKENPQLVAEEFGSYNYKGKPNGKLFVVTNTKA